MANRRSLALRRNDVSAPLRPGAAVVLPSYLTASVGTVTTPDPGPLGPNNIFVFKVRGPLPAAPNDANMIVTQYGTEGDRSFRLYRSKSTGNLTFSTTPTGNAAGNVGVSQTSLPITNDWEWLAFGIARNTTSPDGDLNVTTGQSWKSIDGVTWTPYNPDGPNWRATVTPFDSAGVIRIGDTSPPTTPAQPFGGDIAFVEMRTGLNPAGGTVVWRFDAGEYPGSGTSYTDPRGRAWTLTNAAAITLVAPSGVAPSIWDSALRSDFSYIPEDLDPPKAILHVRDISHTEVEVAFDPLKMPTDPNFGAPTEIALVRSPSGFPATLLDGTMVRRHPPEPPDNDGWVRIPDTGLTPGTWYYYGLFAKYFSEGNTHWLRIGEKSVLLPQEYLSADHLWERVPEWYRRADMEPGGQPGVLRKLIDTVGYQTDAHRTWAYTVGDVWDAEKISADLLPWLGDTLGQPVEYAAGDERYRALLANILPLRKIKGTEKGTEAYLSSLTGYRTRVYSGLNMLPTIDEAEAKYSSGLWLASTSDGGSGATLTRVVSTGAATPGPANGATYHRLTFNGTASQQPWMGMANGTDMTRLIPVTGGHTFVTSAFYRSSFTGTLVAWYIWYDAKGVIINGVDERPFGSVGTAWNRDATTTVTAPATAAFVEVSIGLSEFTTINGLVVEVTEILVADLAWRPEDVPGSANTPPLSGSNPGEYDDVNYYEPPRTVHVNVYPQRINYALNSLFSMDNIPADAWTVAERSTWGLLKQAYDSWGDIHDEPERSTAITAAQTTNPTYSGIVLDPKNNINGITPEWEMQWGQIHPSSGTFNWTQTDTIVNWATAHGLTIRGHCLVWDGSGNPAMMPTWVTGGTWTRTTLLAALQTHITTIVNRYKDRIHVWNCVNEAFEDSGARTAWVMQTVIGNDWIEKCFEYAHAADPTAILLYNDYGNDWGHNFGSGSSNPKYVAILAMLTDFKNRGIPCHGVGIQAHYDTQYATYPHPTDFPACVDDYIALGLKVSVTELDCRVDNTASSAAVEEARQAEITTLLRNTLVARPRNALGLCVWGLSDATNWLGATAKAAPWDASYNPKPFATAFTTVDGEADWGDLAEGFEPLAGDWTITFDTAHQRLVLNPSGAPAFAAQVQSHFVPVVAGDSISAAFVSWATVPGVQLTLAVQFFTDDGPEYALSIDGASTEVHGAPHALTVSPYRYELRNAVVPEGAAFAHVIVETHHTVTYSAYLTEALIENAQVPGTYFNGDEVDSAFGDFFFIGLPHESYSVYYQNYRSFINDAGGSDRITSLMDELLPMETDFVLRTAAFGLY